MRRFTGGRSRPTMTNREARTFSLRREWSKAFTLILVLLLASAIATIFGVRGLVGELQRTAGGLRLETATIAALRGDLVKHEMMAQDLLSNRPVDRSAFVHHQQEISRQFGQAAKDFPTSNGMRATVIKAQQTWQNGLMTYGLWGDQVQALRGSHDAETLAFGTSSDITRATWDSLEVSSHQAMDQGLAHGAALERLLIIALVAMFGSAVAMTFYVRGRMAKDVMRPVAHMHESLLKLQAGEYSYRIKVARHDELGALAVAFNDMAEALHNSHVALILRATHDSLTGLPNRAALTERLTASFSPGSDRRARHESLLFVDIDDFKDVNDSVGHEGGDALLIQLATRLNDCVRAYDLVARLGGDEFAIVVMEDASDSIAVEVAKRIQDALRTPFIVNGDRLTVTVSIGVAKRRPTTSDSAELLRQADSAMYLAKGGGKARYQLFDPEMHDNMVARAALKADLALAADSGQLRMEYQPVADLRTGEILGVEALIRWQHPTLGLLAPASFITLAEETGDIDAISCWALETATRQVARWRQTMDGYASLWVAVNLSAFQLSSSDSLAAIQRILADPAVQADKVILELTETALGSDLHDGIASLHTLKSFGVRLAVDDFGTGLSSLSTLASMPVDILKIDRSFVSGQTASATSVPMLEGILELAGKLSLEVIAEGIEEPEQLDLLRTLGCVMGQGYFLARPAPAHVLEALLASGSLLSPEVRR